MKKLYGNPNLVCFLSAIARHHNSQKYNYITNYMKAPFFFLS